MNQLPKSERLSGRSTIQKIFREGKRFKQFPFNVIWLERKELEEIPLRFGVAVSKRISKKAVVRNHIKRSTREAYRTSKSEFMEELTSNKKQFDFFLVYTGKPSTHTDELREKIILILKRLTAIHGQTSRHTDNSSD
jgi:ribonuclease P protein component